MHGRKGELGYILLGLLNREPKTGYELRKIFGSTPLKSFSDSPGSIYPALRALRSRGLIEAAGGGSGGRGAKYRPTGKGRRRLIAWVRTGAASGSVADGGRRGSFEARLAFMSDLINEEEMRTILESEAEAVGLRLERAREYVADREDDLPLSGRLALDAGIFALASRRRWLRRTIRRLAVAVMLLAAGAASAGDAAAQGVPSRTDGRTSYEFTSSQRGPGKASSITVDLDLVRGQGSDRVELRQAWTSQDSTPRQPVQMPPGCRWQFDAAEGGLGTVTLVDGIDPHRVVPGCVPESLFGAVTDILSVLLVQHPKFGTQRLSQVGDTARFEGFTTEWSRPDPAVAARVTADAGTTSLIEASEQGWVVLWAPDPMHVTVVRRLAPGRVLLLRGLEHFSIELTYDGESGLIRSARTVQDRLEMNMWMVDGPDAPGLDSPSPAPPSRPLTIQREFSLERRSQPS